MDKHTRTSVPIKLLLNPWHCLSLGFGSGLVPKIPGTAGTVVGVVIFVLLPTMDWKLYLGITISAFIAGVFLCDYTARALNASDHPSIVWDEIVGYFITMFMAPADWLWILLGFILFRTLDILKPWPISIADQKVPGGLGVMVDDVIAGIFSLIIMQIILYLL